VRARRVTVPVVVEPAAAARSRVCEADMADKKQGSSPPRWSSPSGPTGATSTSTRARRCPTVSRTARPKRLADFLEDDDETSEKKAAAKKSAASK
jgi:hypothetical protein